ncbi:unnamed protein product, partial [Effrenium voratum]
PEVEPEPIQSEGACDYYFQWMSDHCAKLLLGLSAMLVFVLTIMALIAGFDTLSSNAFFIYSKFAWEQWFPSFFVIIVMLMLLSLVALLVVVFAGLISWKETRALVRAFYMTSASLGLIMLGLALPGAPSVERGDFLWRVDSFCWPGFLLGFPVAR